MRLRGVVVLLLATASGCMTPTPPPAPLDPGANFAAHQISGGFVIDRAPAGGTGLVLPAHWLRWGDDPTFVVRVDDEVVGALWLEAPADVVARVSASGRAPLVQTVEPAWENGAVRLTLRPAAGPPLTTTTFRRLGVGGGWSELSRMAQTNLDVRGTFRAAVLDGDGRPVGWLQVRIDDPVGPRLFEGALPSAVPTAGAAATVALDSEIDWIMDRVIDVHRGTSGGRLHDDDRGGR